MRKGLPSGRGGDEDEPRGKRQVLRKRGERGESLLNILQKKDF